MRGKKPLLSVFGLLLFVTTTAVPADSIDLNTSDKATRLTYASYVSPRVVGDIGMLLHNKPRGEEDMFHLGANLVNQNVRFGLRGTYASPGNQDLLAIGLGLNVRMGLAKNLYFDIGGYYAPEFMSLMDSAGYSELNARVSLSVSRPLELYLGYRNIKVKIKDVSNKVEIDDGLYLGLQFYF